MAKGAKRKSRAKAVVPKEITVDHVRAPNFQSLYADSCLVRPAGDTLVLTFYENDRIVKQQSGELINVEGDASTYQTTSLQEVPVRIQNVAVRLPVVEAVKTAMLMLTQIQMANPSALASAGVEMGDLAVEHRQTKS